MSLIEPSSNEVSATNRLSYKIFRKTDDESSPYIEMQVMSGQGTGGCNDTKIYSYFFFEIFSWANSIKRRENKFTDTEDEAQKLFNKASDYATSKKMLKQLEVQE